jgi:hypothetical protein
MTNNEVTGTDWSSAELDLIVADYFNMLKEEQNGRKYSKTEHRLELMTHLHRSDGSIEFKHQNISAVLTELGLPRISGYRPARNYQGAIFAAIDSYLAKNPDPIPFMARPVTALAELQSLYEEAPPPSGQFRPKRPEGLVRLIRKFDPALRDQLNRDLGQAGEQHIYEHEQRRLLDAGRRDLSQKVRWVSQADGDGAGYDIRSYDETGAERWIEVKTTRGGNRTPFYLTRNENEVAKERPDAFRLYRLYDFSLRPKLFTLTPPLEAILQLEPLTFRASLK